MGIIFDEPKSQVMPSAPKQIGGITFDDPPMQAPSQGGITFDNQTQAISRKTLSQMIDEYSQKHNADSDLVKALIWQESGVNPRAFNASSKATGLGQFIPNTWIGVAKQMNEAPGSPYDVDTMIRRMTYHVGDLQKKFGNRNDLVAAAYKAGEGAVKKAGGVPGLDQRGGYDAHVSETTADYVKKINSRYSKIKKGNAPIRFNAVYDTQEQLKQQAQKELNQPQVNEEPLPEVLAPTPAQKGLLEKSKDVVLKIGRGLNAANAGAWAGVVNLMSDKTFGELYEKYQEEGNPVAIAMKKAAEEMGIKNGLALGAIGFVGDILGDPLTYTGIGALTKVGKVARVAKGVEEIAGASKKIEKLNDTLSRMTEAQRTLAPTMKEQAGLGQRALLQFGGKTVVKGEKVMGALDKAGDAMRPVTGLFSTASKLTDPNARKAFDEAVKESRNLQDYFSRELDNQVANLNRQINQLPEPDRNLVTKIAEDQKMYGEALRGKYGDAGKLGIDMHETDVLMRGLRDGDPEALKKIDAENLIGKWTHKTPELGAAYQKLYDEIARPIQDRVAGQAKRAKIPVKSLEKQSEQVEMAYNNVNRLKDSFEKVRGDFVARSELRRPIQIIQSKINNVLSKTPDQKNVIKRVQEQLAKRNAQVADVKIAEVAAKYKGREQELTKIAAEINRNIASVKTQDIIKALERKGEKELSYITNRAGLKELEAMIVGSPKLYVKAEQGHFGKIGQLIIKRDKTASKVLSMSEVDKLNEALTLKYGKVTPTEDQIKAFLKEQPEAHEYEMLKDALGDVLAADYKQTWKQLMKNASKKNPYESLSNILGRRLDSLEKQLYTKQGRLDFLSDYSKSTFPLIKEATKDLSESASKMPFHVSHVIPDEFKKLLPEGKDFGAAQFTENVADEVSRKLVDASGMPTYRIEDINKFADELGKGVETPEQFALRTGVPVETAMRIMPIAKSIHEFKNSKTILDWIRKRPKDADSFFSTNPGFILRTTAQRTAKAISGASFREQIGKGFGKSADEITKNPEKYMDWKPIDKWKGTDQGKMYFDPEVVKEVERAESAFFGNAETKGLLKVLDTVQNYWKAWTIAVFPGFHIRNFAGAVINNALAGVKNPKYYAHAMNAMNAEMMAMRGISLPKSITSQGDKLAENVIKKNQAFGARQLESQKLNNGMSLKEALQLARQQGITGRQRFQEELNTSGKLSKNVLSIEGPAMRVGQNVGSTIEDNVRLAHFFNKLDDGYSAADAAVSVKKYQFDYGDVTPFEKNVMVRLMPFYRFYRFNIPLQIKNALEKPGYVAGLEKFRRQMNSEQDMPGWKEAFLQDYLSANMSVQIGSREVNGKRIPNMFSLGAWFPTATAISNIGHPISTFISLLSPLAKEPIEQVSNYDSFRKQPIMGPRKLVDQVFGVTVHPRVKHVIRNIRILNTADQLFGSALEEMKPGETTYVLRSGFRPGVMDQVFRLMTGITLSPFDKDEAKRYKLIQLRKEIQEVQAGFRSAYLRKDKPNQDAAVTRFLELRDEVAEIAGLTNETDKILEAPVTQSGGITFDDKGKAP